MKYKLALFSILVLGLLPLYSEELKNEEIKKGVFEIDIEDEMKSEAEKPPEDKTVRAYKEKMIAGIPDKNDLYDITDFYYNDPEKADLFLEAYFNSYDNPDAGPGVKITISREHYNKNKELYKNIRNKKLIITSTTTVFSKYSDPKEYPTGGLLSKYEYNYDKEVFYRVFNEKDSMSKYRWRIKGKKHFCPNIFVEGRIKIAVPKKLARNLSGDLILFSTKRATIMGIFRIKDKTSHSLTIEPIRYMLIWRKKKKVYPNFKASLDPEEMEKASKQYMKGGVNDFGEESDEFGDGPDDDFGDDANESSDMREDDFGDFPDENSDTKENVNKTKKSTGKKSGKKSRKKAKDGFVDEFGDFGEED